MINSESNKEFNLLYEPWILVRNLDGISEEVSLLDLFKKAEKYTTLAGELPTQDIAVMRLLLAVLHGAYGNRNIEGVPFPDNKEAQIKGSLELWKVLWEKGLSYERIETYLEKYEDRFWLFHPETPFYQVADMEKGTVYSASKLNGEILESGHKARLFPMMAGSTKKSLTYAQAARWLIHLNGFDDTSGKPTQKGLPSPGVGWLGQLGLINAMGQNLSKTLLLNLVLISDEKNEIWGTDKAIWEEPPHTKERVQINTPDSQAALLTLQSRRILLTKDGGTVKGCTIQGGEFMSRVDATEQMTLWMNITKKNTELQEYTPKRHHPDVQIWRRLPYIINQSDVVKRPGVINWLIRLIDEKILHEPLLNVVIVGVDYADKNTAITDIYQDTLSFSSALLSDSYSSIVRRSIVLTNIMVGELMELAEKVTKASGNKNKKSIRNVREKAMAQAYYMLDMPFRQWLDSIKLNDTRLEAKRLEWWDTLQPIVRDIGREIVENCTPRAFKISNENSAPEAYNWFIYNTSRKVLEKSEGKPSIRAQLANGKKDKPTPQKTVAKSKNKDLEI